MLGDAAQPADSDGPRDEAATGPRHAVPRKPLLTRLHVPAGKAVALAAMPTAVLMGMGFTPHFAQADEMPSAPFKPGPCVSRADTPPPTTPAPGSTPSPKTTPTAGGTPSPTATPTGGTTATGHSAPATTKPATRRADPMPSPTGAGPATSTTTSGSSPATPPAVSTTTGTHTDPLDPLGLGDVLSKLLGGGTSSTPTAPASPTPTPSTTAPHQPAPPPAPKPSASTPATTSGAGSTDGRTTGRRSTHTATPGSTAGVTKKTDGSGTDATPGATTGKSGATTKPDGPQSYPCPTYDAEALAAADVEGGIPLLPDQPFTLKTTRLALHGLSYHGIVKVRTWSGQTKDALKFTASGIDIDNLWQIVDAPGGTHTWVKSRPGATSTFTGGTVTLYTESLSGNLLGLIPVTFTPQAPPPLTLPELFFTDATVVNAGQFGGDLTVPGMRVLPDQP